MGNGLCIYLLKCVLLDILGSQQAVRAIRAVSGTLKMLGPISIDNPVTFTFKQGFSAKP